MKIPVFLPVTREFGFRDEFARDCLLRRPAQVAACFAEIFSLYEQGKVKPGAAILFPLARAGEALAALRDRRIAGRAVLELCDD
jgi:NADPH:quinone reductase-like Zn-dependent oxidoreductase